MSETRRPHPAFPLPPDEDQARDDGRVFGRAAGLRASSRMMAAEQDSGQLQAVGAAEVEAILARADAMASAGVDREIVAAWTDEAADAFNAELDRAASLLRAREASSSKH